MQKKSEVYSMFPYHIYDALVVVEAPHYVGEKGRDSRYLFMMGKEGIPHHNKPSAWGNGIYPGGYGVGVWTSGNTKDSLYFGTPDPAGFSPYEKPGDNVWKPRK